jgi:hypothetical protein
MAEHPALRKTLRRSTLTEAEVYLIAVGFLWKMVSNNLFLRLKRALNPKKPARTGLCPPLDAPTSPLSPLAPEIYHF